VEYIQANRIRTLMMRKMAALMQPIDVLVVPPFASNALVLSNLTGYPSVVLPNGFTEKGTPTGITFMGNLYHEADVLAVAKGYQDATDFHRQYSPMSR
jgi:Asp-tRNA(Asn)/Glu-tRNA(Gln) amidotransferase A subunit family amidase